MENAQGERIQESAPEHVSASFEELLYASEEIDWDLDDDSQSRIADIEASIQSLFGRTEARLESLENPEQEDQPVDFMVQYRDGKLFARDEAGEEQSLTRGELLTDGDWGVRYGLDRSVPYDIRKQYILENARRELQILADRKMLIEQIANPHIDAMKRDTYRRILEDLEGGVEHFGFIAERMVKNYFKKLALDGISDFEVHEASVVQDVDQKVDFILHRKSHYRGVGVHQDNGPEGDIGVQFTINTTPQKIWQKKGQLQKEASRTQPGHVEDYVLVSMDKRQFASFYNRWLKDKNPGGPDRLWHLGIKEEIFRKTMRKFISGQEIDSQWEHIRQSE